MKTNQSICSVIQNPCDMVVKWLLKYLPPLEPIDSSAVKQEFEWAFPDISERTLERARNKIPIEVIRKAIGEHGTLWVLSLNDEKRNDLLDQLLILENELKEEIESESPPEPEFRNVEIRAQLIQRYGEHCSLCPNPYFGFLELDHINGGGYAHRKRCGSSLRMYQEILAEGYRPDKYRILCKVCNQLARFFSDDEIKSWWKPLRFPKGE